jgi:hypothetical protein
MNPSDQSFIRQTLAMALGAILMSPDTETKSQMIERLKRSMEKLDAQCTIEGVNKIVVSVDPNFGATN